MALRLLELVLQERDSGDVRELLKDCKVLEHRHIRLTDDEVLVRILLDAVQSETVLDLLEKQYTGREGYRVMVLPVEATLPRAQVEPEETAAPEPSAPEEKTPERIGREELYEDIKNGAQLSRVYMALVALSTVVAAIGLYHNSVAVIIGAMVIAPLLGPNIALSLGITLGDVSLLRKGLLTALAGNVAALALSVLIGLLLDVDPTLSELVLRTQVGLGDIVLALASGCAGALAFTTGVSTALIGVMVAVAMLPPLVTSGLLFGGGHPTLAMGALSLFLVNLICVNLAGVTTFLIQGIKPTNWWDKVQAKKATRIAIALSIVLLAVLVGIILLVHKG
ncbi:TIGR00341 family protein [Prodigiosinella aquatilis]|nr:TIGR00341 family protein [Prodigiosinella sp. LS101]WJV55778.1 TIGR00341 family protein [Prodigiosinella sp. LS101]WJV60140.1 TIGR00341 family protein [Pectobacteriaceae bacterium C111]